MADVLKGFFGGQKAEQAPVAAGDDGVYTLRPTCHCAVT